MNRTEIISWIGNCRNCGPFAEFSQKDTKSPQHEGLFRRGRYTASDRLQIQHWQSIIFFIYLDANNPGILDRSDLEDRIISDVSGSFYAADSFGGRIPCSPFTAWRIIPIIILCALALILLVDGVFFFRLHREDQRIQDCLQKITTASKHLLTLINEVLERVLRRFLADRTESV